jgi:hypothetical protein
VDDAGDHLDEQLGYTSSSTTSAGGIMAGISDAATAGMGGETATA